MTAQNPPDKSRFFCAYYTPVYGYGEFQENFCFVFRVKYTRRRNAYPCAALYSCTPPPGLTLLQLHKRLSSTGLNNRAGNDISGCMRRIARKRRLIASR